MENAEIYLAAIPAPVIKDSKKKMVDVQVIRTYIFKQCIGEVVFSTLVSIPVLSESFFAEMIRNHCRYARVNFLQI